MPLEDHCSFCKTSPCSPFPKEGYEREDTDWLSLEIYIFYSQLVIKRFANNSCPIYSPYGMFCKVKIGV